MKTRSTKPTAKNQANPVTSGFADDLPAVLFDLDGTLVDSVFQHVSAWSGALEKAGFVIPRWKVHRRIGMSGKSFVKELLREHGNPRRNLGKMEKQHDADFSRSLRGIQRLPGANELLAHLSRHKIKVAIATTGNRKQTSALLGKLRVPSKIPIVTGDDVEKAKPSPDIFVAAAQRLNVSIGDCIVVGDSVWDLLAAGRKSALGVGLLSGGYGQEELERAGAFRVYSDPADILQHIEQLGLPSV
ncbi:MAG: HAD family phosphatase [Candidatus Sulfotelmatobacter sp.]